MIRRATEQETNTILQMTGHIIQESTAGYATNGSQKAYQMFAPLLQNGAYYLVAIQNQRVIGWIMLGQDRNPLTNEYVGSLLDLYVLLPYRKQRIGDTLMKAAINELKQQGFRVIQLNVFAGNTAKSIYEKLGFKDVAHLMELRFTDTPATQI
jgi:L-amino acid N-acyltransferase YncA